MWHKFHLLIVAPSLSVRILLRSHLEQLNYSVDFAWDMDSVLIQAESTLYDFILIDETLDTQISCSKLIDTLHSKSNRNQETPIVFLTSPDNFQQEVTKQYYTIRRPVTGEETLNLIEFLLKIKPLGLNR